MATIPMIGYVTIGGAKKDVAIEYVNVNGVWKAFAKTYGNVNGVWKNAWETSFTWKKYNVIHNVQYTSKKTSDTVAVRQDNFKKIYAGTGYTFDNGTGIYSLTNAINIGIDDMSKYRSEKYFMPKSTGSVMYEFMDTDFVNIDGYLYYCCICYEYTSSQSSTSVIGSYISDVTAETENAYPANGIHTDGYWYVKQ